MIDNMTEQINILVGDDSSDSDSQDDEDCEMSDAEDVGPSTSGSSCFHP